MTCSKCNVQLISVGYSKWVCPICGEVFNSYIVYEDENVPSKKEL